MQKTLTEEMKKQVDERYINTRGLIKTEDFTQEQKQYLAIRYGWYSPIENQINFELAKQIVASNSSLIGPMLSFCKSKEEQKQLVKISMDQQDNSLHLVNTYPFLLLDYLKNNCEALPGYAKSFKAFKNTNQREIIISDKKYNNMKNYTQSVADFGKVYKQVNVEAELAKQKQLGN